MVLFLLSREQQLYHQEPRVHDFPANTIFVDSASLSLFFNSSYLCCPCGLLKVPQIHLLSWTKSPQANAMLSLPLPLPQQLPLFSNIQKSLRYYETIPKKGSWKSLLLPNHRMNLHLRLNFVKQVNSNGKKTEQMKFFTGCIHILFWENIKNCFLVYDIYTEFRICRVPF